MVEYQVNLTNNDEITVKIEDRTYRFMYIPEEKIVILPTERSFDIKLKEKLKEHKKVREVYSNEKANYKKS